MDDMMLQDLAMQVGTALAQQELMLVTAESCTGGWLGQVITSVAGSSGWYERGFITYATASKQEMLAVSNATLEQYGSVSEQQKCECLPHQALGCKEQHQQESGDLIPDDTAVIGIPQCPACHSASPDTDTKRGNKKQEKTEGIENIFEYPEQGERDQGTGCAGCHGTQSGPAGEGDEMCRAAANECLVRYRPFDPGGRQERKSLSSGFIPLVDRRCGRGFPLGRVAVRRIIAPVVRLGNGHSL